jgi:pSer/pThr/pTyr-binding forkhead associated (FHA) protein/uncharacterized protein YegL
MKRASIFSHPYFRYAWVGAIGCVIGAILFEILFPSVAATSSGSVQHVALVIDTSGSMRDQNKLEEVKRAAISFVNRQGMGSANSATGVALIEFSTNASTVQAMTRDANALTARINELEANGGTNIGAAVIEAGRALGADDARSVPSSLLLFTDGRPDVAGESEAQGRRRAIGAAQQIRAAGVKIIAIGTEDADPGFLTELTGSPDLVFSTTAGTFDAAFQRADKKIRQIFQSGGAGSGNPFEALARAWGLGMLLGLSLGAALLIAENVWGLRGRWWRDLNWVPLGAALLGALGAIVGQLVYGLLPDSPTSRAWGWAILGAAVGAMLGLADRSKTKAGRGAFGGFAGGLAGGLVFDFLSKFLTIGAGDTGILARVLGLAVLGFAVGLMVQVVQQALKTAWLSGITTGPYEGKQYILGKPIVTVGRSDGNDIGLYRENNLGLKAGSFSFNAGRWSYAGEALQINGSSQTNATLSSGDTIRLGDTEFIFEDKGSPQVQPEDQEQPEPRAAVPTAIPTPVPPPVSPPTPTSSPVSSPVSKPTRWKLNGDPILEITSPAKLTLGRVADNNLVIDDANVSSHHAIVEATQDTLNVTDLGSTNGTKLNGAALEANKMVNAKAGDTLEFGDRSFKIERD